MQFEGSARFSVGMEVELQLLDADSLDLADRIRPVMDAFPGSPYVKPEFVQDTVEVLSDPQLHVHDMERQLRGRVAEVLAICPRLGLRLAGAGTHPFGTRLALVTPRPRYDRISEDVGLLGQQQIVFGTHVHLGLPDGDEAVMLMGELRPYLPLLLALSANSPFWRGHDTKFASYRQCLVAAMRSYGQPPVFPSWDAFARAVDSMRRAGLVEEVTDLHWDLRLQPRLGTLEVRIMDSQVRLTHSVQLAACLRALVRYLQRSRRWAQQRPIQPLPWWVHKHNMFTVARFGRAARVMVDGEGRARPLAELVDGLFEDVAGPADELGERPYLDALQARWRSGLGYECQQTWHRAHGSLHEVTGCLVEELEAELRQGTSAAAG